MRNRYQERERVNERKRKMGREREREVPYHDDFVLVLTGAVCFLHTMQSITV